MILTLKPGAKKREIDKIIQKVKELGFAPHVSTGRERTIIGVIGQNAIITRNIFEAFPTVEFVTPISKPYKLVSREFKKESTVIRVGKAEIGGARIAVIAGPCSVESEEITLPIARLVKECGAHFFRGGAFKPRTSPYAFQGMGEDGLRILAKAGEITDLPVVTEVMNPRYVSLVEEYSDIIQIGARNVQNYDLLKEVGNSRKPVLLKRGFATTIEEWLMSAEYILARGNYQVILAERGIRTFETATRFTLDLNAVPVIKHLTHLPIIVDPSHGVGIRNYVPALARAAIAAGADGLMLEVHIHPEKALSDGPQSLYPEQFRSLMTELNAVAQAVGRKL